MAKPDIRKVIGEYLKEAKLMCLATAKDYKPWACTVWYVHDEDWNLYFISQKARRHSIELKENQNVAGTIVLPHVKGSGEKVRGLQFEGTARACKLTELMKAHKLYISKYELAEDIPKLELLKLSLSYTYYKITPSVIVLFDEINFPDEPRQELALK